MRRACLACLVAFGCGRLDFDARVAPDGGTGALTLSYPRTAVAAVLGATQVSLTPTVSAPAQFTLAPALPTGLQLDPASGVISGIGTQSAHDLDVTVTATAGSATAQATITITVLPGYVVDTGVDASDANGGTDTTCLSTMGGCTLRAAIETANHATTTQLVLLAADTYVLQSPLPAITDDIEIAGQGAASTVIEPATLHPANPAFALATAHMLALRDLTIQDFGGNDGGALAVTAGNLDVDRCAFTNNASPTSGGVLFINGGATATLARSTFTGNSSNGGNGGGWGGVIDGEGTGTAILVRQSTATGNKTAWGSFSHITTGTTLRLENSTLYDNTSSTAGTLATPGGIYTLVNDTIAGNHNTNAIPDSAGLYLYSAPCHYTVINTLVAFNHDMTGAEHNCNRLDLSTTLTSGGGNVFSDTAENCAMYFTQPGDLLSTDPGLDPTAPSDHGGATATLLLLPGGPAIDGAQDAVCPATDQRGVQRPVGAHCDVGAVEMTP